MTAILAWFAALFLAGIFWLWSRSKRDQAETSGSKGASPDSSRKEIESAKTEKKNSSRLKLDRTLEIDFNDPGREAHAAIVGDRLIVAWIRSGKPDDRGPIRVRTWRWDDACGPIDPPEADRDLAPIVKAIDFDLAGDGRDLFLSNKAFVACASCDRLEQESNLGSRRTRR